MSKLVFEPATANLTLSNQQKKLIEKLKISNFFQFDEKDHCFSCGGDSFEKVAENDRYGFSLDYLKCESCGYLFANPYYTDHCLSVFYSEYYSSIYGREGSEKKVFEGEYVNASDKIWPMLKKYIDGHRSVLDFGCGYGGALMAFPKSWYRLGYDFDEVQLNYGRKFGLELKHIGGADESTEKFDIVMLNQVLEHVRDPVAMLKRIAKFLSANSLLYVEVPGFKKVFDEAIDPRLTFKNAHRHHFCVATLKNVAEKAGLVCLEADEGVSAIFRLKNQSQTYLEKSRNMKSSLEWVSELAGFDSQGKIAQKLSPRKIMVACGRQYKIQKLRLRLKYL